MLSVPALLQMRKMGSAGSSLPPRPPPRSNTAHTHTHTATDPQTHRDRTSKSKTHVVLLEAEPWQGIGQVKREVTDLHHDEGMDDFLAFFILFLLHSLHR